LYGICFSFIPNASTSSIVEIKSFHLREQKGNGLALAWQRCGGGS
jgi:hypothetical protein